MRLQKEAKMYLDSLRGTHPILVFDQYIAFGPISSTAVREPTAKTHGSSPKSLEVGARVAAVEMA